MTKYIALHHRAKKEKKCKRSTNYRRGAHCATVVWKAKSYIVGIKPFG